MWYVFNTRLSSACITQNLHPQINSVDEHGENDIGNFANFVKTNWISGDWFEIKSGFSSSFQYQSKSHTANKENTEKRHFYCVMHLNYSNVVTGINYNEENHIKESLQHKERLQVVLRLIKTVNDSLNSIINLQQKMALSTLSSIFPLLRLCRGFH